MKRYGCFLMLWVFVLWMGGCSVEPAEQAIDATEHLSVVTEEQTCEEEEQTTTVAEVGYTLRITRNDQAIYPTPSYDGAPVDMVGESGVYTIVEEAEDEYGNLWGKLKSGLGWVDLTEIRSEDYESALMSANYAEDTLMPEGECHHYSTGRECLSPIIFRTYSDLQNVTLFTLEFAEEDYVPGEDFFTLPEMTTEKPLVAELDFPGDFSAYGVRFEDEYGMTHTYHIADNLAYNKLIFKEIKSLGIHEDGIGN